MHVSWKWRRGWCSNCTARWDLQYAGVLDTARSWMQNSEKNILFANIILYLQAFIEIFACSPSMLMSRVKNVVCLNGHTTTTIVVRILYYTIGVHINTRFCSMYHVYWWFVLELRIKNEKKLRQFISILYILDERSQFGIKMEWMARNQENVYSHRFKFEELKCLLFLILWHCWQAWRGFRARKQNGPFNKIWEKAVTRSLIQIHDLNVEV